MNLVTNNSLFGNIQTATQAASTKNVRQQPALKPATVPQNGVSQPLPLAFTGAQKATARNYQAALMIRPAVKFGYGPSSTELGSIQQALTGWKGENGAVLAPSYMPQAETIDAIQKLLAGGRPVPSSVVTQLATQKLEAMNLNRFLLGQPLTTLDAIQPEAEQFFKDLRAKMESLNESALIPANGFNLSAKAVFNKFVAQTAPILFTMGFDDAVDHSGDVAQLSIKQAIQNGAKGPEVVQSAMVGWLHDPKMHKALSWSNLATHPVVGSAVAQHVLNQPEVRNAIVNYLSNNALTENPNNPLVGPFRFISGITEALTINNDSKWVLENVILAKHPTHPLAEKGLGDAVPEVKPLMLNRFLAPSRGQIPEKLSDEMVDAIDQVSLSTDMRGVSTAALKAALKTDSDEVAQAFYQRLVSGNVTDKEQLQDVRKALRAAPEGILNPKVKGSSLLAHHSEVKDAPLAALALAISDPLLLSPHKIVAAGFQKTPLERIVSFTNSIQDNISFLPLQAQAEGKQWLLEVYTSMLKAADSLTGNQTLLRYYDSQDAFAVSPLDTKVAALKTLVEDEKSWQKREFMAGNGSASSVTLDYGGIAAAEPTNKLMMERLFTALKTNYEAAARQSGGLFGQTALNTQDQLRVS